MVCVIRKYGSLPRVHLPWYFRGEIKNNKQFDVQYNWTRKLGEATQFTGRQAQAIMYWNRAEPQTERADILTYTSERELFKEILANG